jgi:hypothetical protein
VGEDGLAGVVGTGGGEPAPPADAMGSQDTLVKPDTEENPPLQAFPTHFPNPLEGLVDHCFWIIALACLRARPERVGSLYGGGGWGRNA